MHGGRHPELDDVADCLAELRADLEPHLAKEERVLFPMIRQLATDTAPPAFHCGSIRNPIVGHDPRARQRRGAAGAPAPADRATTSLRSTPARPTTPSTAGCEELEADTHLHIHKENNVLFPMVVALEDQPAT